MMKSPVEGLRHRGSFVAMNDGACGKVFAGYCSFLIHPDSIPASVSIPQNLQSINRPDLEPCFSRWVFGPTKWPPPRPWHMHSRSHCPAQVLDKQKLPTEELDRQEKGEWFLFAFRCLELQFLLCPWFFLLNNFKSSCLFAFSCSLFAFDAHCLWLHVFPSNPRFKTTGFVLWR